MSDLFPTTWNRYVPAATLIGSSIGVYTAIRALGIGSALIQKMIETQGSDWMVAFAAIVGAFYFMPKLIQALTEQAIALTTLAEGIKGLPQKDNLKFEEIIIGQEMLNKGLDRIHSRLDALPCGGPRESCPEDEKDTLE